jgi:hypothetical protein
MTGGDIERARRADILAVAENLLGVRELKRSGSEFTGPCPMCGGRGRFTVDRVKGLFNCRGCGVGGDVIDLVRFVRGGTVGEAAALIGAEHALAWALRTGALGLSVFPAGADKRPLVPHWRADAARDPETIKGWWRKWPHADVAVALAANMVVADADMSRGQRGLADIERLSGMAIDDIPAPRASTPSGGAHFYFRAVGRRYRNVRIPGTAIDVKSEGGYVLAPGCNNGRKWLRSLWDTPLPPPPAWLDPALRRAPLTPAPRAALIAPAFDPWARRKALAALEQACAQIAAALCGAQEDTRHRQCFYIGGLVARGDLSYAEAYAALLEAARAMPAYREPWRNLEERVARSLEAGVERPLAISETESWMRDFRARMRLRRPTMPMGARHG